MAYTPQLTDPIRIDIGRLLLAHELTKIFPHLGSYGEIKNQVNDRWNDFSDIVTIRDFWNLVDSLMMGYKLKNIVKGITSQSYTWNLVANQPITSLKFSSDINNLVINTKTATEVKSLLEANPTEMARITEATRVAFPENDTRHLDPIVILNHDDALFVQDGNGRLLKAIVEGQETVSAYVGTKTQAIKSNHWIPTAYLMKLTELKLKNFLLDAFRESDNACFEFQDRISMDDQFKQEVLNEIQT